MELPITPIILGLIPINPIILGLKVNMDGWQIKLNMMGMEDGDIGVHWGILGHRDCGGTSCSSVLLQTKMHLQMPAF